MNNNRSVQDKIRADEYHSKLEYPKGLSSKDPEYHRLRDLYRQDSTRLVRQLKADIFEQYGVTDNPKAELLWNKCWDLGHSYGYSEVVNHFDDLVELIQD